MHRFVMLRHRLALALLGCLVLASCTTAEEARPPAASASPTPAPSVTAPPAIARLSLQPCLLGDGVAARCGTLQVPENWRASAGRTIGLRVAVLPATGPAPAPDPVFFLSGGPGGVASEDFLWTAVALAELNRTRDFVLVDQRGVGQSNPLTCPNPGFSVREVLAPEGEALVRTFVARCLDQLPGDPAVYTSDAAADDLDAVRAALRYEQINLYGGSYGATLAQYYVLRHPERVRTMFLEGASLLGVPMRERWPITRQAALRGLMAACAEDARCNDRYPGLQTMFETVVARVSERPVTTTLRSPAGTPIVVDRLTLYLLTNGLLLSTDGQRSLPALFSAAYTNDDYLPLAQAYQQILQYAQGSLVQPMQWSILCSEDWAQFDVKAVSEAARGTYFAAESVAEARAYAAVCSYLPRSPGQAGYATRLRTDVPTLFVVGELDPQDPLEHLATRTTDAPNHRVVVLPGEAHGTSPQAHACRFSLLTTFITSGSLAAPDTTCAAKHRPPPFR